MSHHSSVFCTLRVLFVTLSTFAAVGGGSRSIAASEPDQAAAPRFESLSRTSPNRLESVFDGTWLQVPPPLGGRQFIIHDEARDRVIAIDAALQPWSWTVDGWEAIP